MDKISTIRRSANMAAIRSKNTKPEMAVRKFLFRSGLRFRLHAAGLPGRPDLVFPARRVAVFVHGCFWHGCKKCIDGTRKVKSNSAYWTQKVLQNQIRDRKNQQMLRKSGWQPITIWECEARNQARLQKLSDTIRRTFPLKISK